MSDNNTLQPGWTGYSASVPQPPPPAVPYVPEIWRPYLAGASGYGLGICTANTLASYWP